MSSSFIRNDIHDNIISSSPLLSPILSPSSLEEKELSNDMQNISLDIFIQNLIDKNLLTLIVNEDDGYKYKCICDSIVKRQNLRQHLKSSKHLKNEKNDKNNLTNIIAIMLEQKIFIDIGENKFQCICDSKIQRSNVKLHLNSNKHVLFIKYGSHEAVKNMKENEKKQKKIEQRKKLIKECDICCKSELKFYTCGVCRHPYCMNCYLKVDRCPFCRTNLMEFKFIVELNKRMKKINTMNDAERRMETYYSLCRYIYKYRNIFKLPRNHAYYNAFRNTLFSSYYNNGFESGLLFYRLIYEE